MTLIFSGRFLIKPLDNLQEYKKRQKEADIQAEREMRKVGSKEKSNMLHTLRKKIHYSGSMHNLTNVGNSNWEKPRPTFSAIVGGTITGRGINSTVQKKALASKNRLGTFNNGDFKVSVSSPVQMDSTLFVYRFLPDLVRKDILKQ